MTVTLRFSPGEVLDMAEELERRGIAFYANLVKQTNDPKSKEIFTFLEEEEKRHLDYFQKIKSDLNANADFFPDTMDETINYLGSIIENGVLGKVLKGVDLMHGDTSVIKALEVGIEVEKESVLFYQGMDIMIPASKKEWLNKVIQEEKKHFTILTGMMKDLMATSQ